MINLMLARRSKKLTQKQLAKRVGISNIQICRFENGTTSPKADLLQKIAEELEVSMDYLMQRKQSWDSSVDMKSQCSIIPGLEVDYSPERD